MLEKLGKVLHKTHNGYIVATVEAKKLPQLNTPVYREEARRVGILLDIIGPVKSPYVVIKPDRPDIEVKPGMDLYYRKPVPRRGRGRAPRGGKSPRPPSKRGRRR